MTKNTIPFLKFLRKHANWKSKIYLEKVTSNYFLYTIFYQANKNLQKILAKKNLYDTITTKTKEGAKNVSIY